MNDGGFVVCPEDISLLSQLMQRLGLCVSQQSDTFIEVKIPFFVGIEKVFGELDYILADVPCTIQGVLFRKSTGAKATSREIRVTPDRTNPNVVDRLKHIYSIEQWLENDDDA